jgi:riboflavin transporter FmnP
MRLVIKRMQIPELPVVTTLGLLSSIILVFSLNAILFLKDLNHNPVVGISMEFLAHRIVLIEA